MFNQMQHGKDISSQVPWHSISKITDLQPPHLLLGDFKNKSHTEIILSVNIQVRVANG